MYPEWWEGLAPANPVAKTQRSQCLPTAGYPLYEDGLLPLPAARVEDLKLLSLCRYAVRHLQPSHQPYYLELNGNGEGVPGDEGADGVGCGVHAEPVRVSIWIQNNCILTF